MVGLIYTTDRFGTNRASDESGVKCPAAPATPRCNSFEPHFAAWTARGESHLRTQITRLTQISGCAAGVLALLLIGGCSSKKYVRSQTAPLIQHTNELDDQTATNNRNLKNLDEK